MQDSTSTLLGPVEGWVVWTRSSIGFVKGCHHPLPKLIYVPRVVNGRKIWDYAEAIRLLEATEPGLVDVGACLGRRVGLVDPGSARLVSPVEALKRLRGECNSSLCRAALELAELLRDASGVEGCIGVTGGLAYNPESAHDIDIVVYGLREASRVYRALVELRETGLTEAFRGSGHAWSPLDNILAGMLSSRRVLLGLYKGFEYNVRLVACRKPLPCFKTRVKGSIAVRGTLCRGLGYTTPAIYELCTDKGSRLIVVSYRLRYTELPIGSKIEVYGRLELWGSTRVIVPDIGGYVKLLSLPSTSLEV